MNKLLITLLLSLPCYALHESDYVDLYCKGEKEVRIEGGRIDCETLDSVQEFEFAQKWHESISQALYYRMMTGKRAEIVLIIKSEKDLKYKERLESVINFYELPIVVRELYVGGGGNDIETYEGERK